MKVSKETSIVTWEFTRLPEEILEMQDIAME